MSSEPKRKRLPPGKPLTKQLLMIEQPKHKASNIPLHPTYSHNSNDSEYKYDDSIEEEKINNWDDESINNFQLQLGLNQVSNYSDDFEYLGKEKQEYEEEEGIQQESEYEEQVKQLDESESGRPPSLRQQSEVKVQQSGKGKGRGRTRRKQINSSFIIAAKQYFESYNKDEEEGKINKGKSLRRFAEQTGYGYSTIYHLYKQWLQDPILLRVQESVKRNCEGRMKGKSRKTSLREVEVVKILDENPLLTSAEVAQKLQCSQLGMRAGRDGILVPLHQKAVVRIFSALKLKRVRIKLISSKRNSPEDIEARRLYCLKMLNCLQRSQRIYFMDEMTINRYVGRDKAWGKPSQPFANVMLHLKASSILLLALMGSSGSVKYQAIHGNSSREKYEQVIERLLTKPSEKYPNEPKTLVIHEKVGPALSVMRDVAQQRGFRIMILPAFSSQLNPLEQWFGEVRMVLKRDKCLQERDLLAKTKEALEIVKTKNVTNYFESVQKYLQKGVQRELF